MRLCMFHPVDHPMERGWVGRIEDDHVVHLAAQTLQSFFTGGGSAREHAVYPLEGVRLLAPVLHPPSVRVFDEESSFAFANPAAIVGPAVEITPGDSTLALLPRLAAVLGTEGKIGGYTVFGEWRRPVLREPKDRDFAFGLGPVVLTGDDLPMDDVECVVSVDGSERVRSSLGGFDWEHAHALAAEGTALFAGDLLAGPAAATLDVPRGSEVAIDVTGIGTLAATTGR